MRSRLPRPGSRAAPGDSARSRSGLTLIEGVVGMMLLVLIMTVVVRNLRFGRLSQDAIERLDRIQELRLAQRRVVRAIEEGTTILYPTVGGTASVVAFTDASNQPRIVIREGTELVMLGTDGSSEVLARDLGGFQVSHPLENQVEMRLATVPMAKGGILETVVTVHAANHFHGKGIGPP